MPGSVVSRPRGAEGCRGMRALTGWQSRRVAGLTVFRLADQRCWSWAMAPARHQGDGPAGGGWLSESDQWAGRSPRRGFTCTPSTGRPGPAPVGAEKAGATELATTPDTHAVQSAAHSNTWHTTHYTHTHTTHTTHYTLHTTLM